MIEMEVNQLRATAMRNQAVVILKEKMANRYLPIWIGPDVADAIAVKLANIELSRPLTHDLLQSVISTLGASVNFIVVNELQNDTFYAKLSLAPHAPHISQVDEHHEERRGRISFLWHGSPYSLKIMSERTEPGKRLLEVIDDNANKVFELCCYEATGDWLINKIEIDSRPSDALALAVRIGAPIYAEESVLDKAGITLEEEVGKPVSKGKVSEEELKGLSAYKDFINTLNLEDFKKRRS